MDLPHHLVGVFRGRCDRHGPPQRTDRLNETERIGERSDTPGVNQFHELLLLVLGIDNSLPFSVRHTQCLQRSTRAAETRFAGHLRLIHGGRESSRVGETFKRFAPSSLMGRRQQDAVNVENACGQRFGMVGLRSR